MEDLNTPTPVMELDLVAQETRKLELIENEGERLFRDTDIVFTGAIEQMLYDSEGRRGNKRVGATLVEVHNFLDAEIDRIMAEQGQELLPGQREFMHELIKGIPADGPGTPAAVGNAGDYLEGHAFSAVWTPKALRKAGVWLVRAGLAAYAMNVVSSAAGFVGTDHLGLDLQTAERGVAGLGFGVVSCAVETGGILGSITLVGQRNEELHRRTTGNGINLAGKAQLLAQVSADAIKAKLPGRKARMVVGGLVFGLTGVALGYDGYTTAIAIGDVFNKGVDNGWVRFLVSGSGAVLLNIGGFFLIGIGTNLQDVADELETHKQKYLSEVGQANAFVPSLPSRGQEDEDFE